MPVDECVDRAKTEAEYLRSLPLDHNRIQVTVAHAYENESRNDDLVERPEAVQVALQTLRDEGFAVEHREISGIPSDGIVTLAEDLAADEIIMAGRKRTPAAKVVFGSVTQSVILNSNRPVTVVGFDDE
jgi:nucleotide-binding universal stress UspA family protein